MPCDICNKLQSDIKDKEDYINVSESKMTAASYYKDQEYKRADHLQSECERAKAAFDQDAHNHEKERQLGEAQEALRAAKDAAKDATDRMGDALRERDQYVAAKHDLEDALRGHICPTP